MIKKIICVLIIIVFVVEINVFATSKQELTEQSKELDTKILQKENEIENKNLEISDAVKKVQELSVKIGENEDSIRDLTIKIDSISSDIETKQKNIKEKEEQIEKKQRLLEKRLVAIYENGNISYIDFLLGSTDLSDFISRYYLISELVECDTSLINSFKSIKEELEREKANLEEDKISIENAKEEQMQKQQELENIKSEKEKKVKTLNTEEKKLQEELEEMEEGKREIEEKLAEIAIRNNQDTNTYYEQDSDEFIFPIQNISINDLSGLVYPSYPGHTGIDINWGNVGSSVEGRTVIAAKSGTVETSKAIRNSNGEYISYGEYILINHHDGTMTCYAHMQANSRLVFSGDEVVQGQAIGKVGSTGNSSGPHLHFEIRIWNGYRYEAVNPISYL